MQLPRGTFREIRKRVNLSNLLGELEMAKFSGICSISQGNSTGTLVFQNGRVILAGFRDKNGDIAWDELTKTRDDIDASLSSLTDAQIQLALEFNKSSRILKSAVHPVKTSRTIPPTSVPVKVPGKPVPSSAPLPKPLQRATLVTRPARFPDLPGHRTVPASPAVAASSPPAPKVSSENQADDKPKSGSADTEGCPEPTSFENDIATFDRMNLEEVADKIRKDCKIMIKDLNLEHLIER